jgi:hypothetical protein
MKASDKIRQLLAKGLSAIEIAKRLKVKASYVHTIKWLDKKAKAKQKVQVERSHDPKVVKAEKKYLETVKQAMDAIEKKPTKLIVQPQYKDVAMKLLADNDLVNHPPHYKSGGIETIDFIEAKDLNYRLGNVVKYVARAGKKATDPVQDLEKALWYLQREITARKNA